MRNQVSEFRSHLVPKLRSHDSAAKWCRLKKRPQRNAAGVETNDQGSKIKFGRNFGLDIFIFGNHDFHSFSMLNLFFLRTSKIFPVTLGAFVLMKPLMSLMLGIAPRANLVKRMGNRCLALQAWKQKYMTWRQLQDANLFLTAWKQSKKKKQQAGTARGIC